MKKRNQFKGIIAAMVTAMNEDESLHEAEIRRQVNRQIVFIVGAVAGIISGGGLRFAETGRTHFPGRQFKTMLSRLWD